MKKTNFKNLFQSNSIRNWLKFLIIVGIIVGSIYAMTTYIPFFSEKQSYIVVSDSMEPTIMRGDLVIINKNFDVSALQVEDIIAFYQDLNENGTNEIVVHYIADISQNEFGVTEYRTKHENVDSYVNWDAWFLTENDIVGVYWLQVPKIGSFLLFLSSWFGKLVVIIDVIVIFLAIDYLKSNKKETVKEEIDSKEE